MITLLLILCVKLTDLCWHFRQRCILGWWWITPNYDLKSNYLLPQIKLYLSRFSKLGNVKSSIVTSLCALTLVLNGEHLNNLNNINVFIGSQLWSGFKEGICRDSPTRSDQVSLWEPPPDLPLPRPRGQDLVAPLKTTAGTRESRVVLFFPNPDFYDSETFTISPWWLWLDGSMSGPPIT